MSLQHSLKTLKSKFL